MIESKKKILETWILEFRNKCINAATVDDLSGVLFRN